AHALLQAVQLIGPCYGLVGFPGLLCQGQITTGDLMQQQGLEKEMVEEEGNIECGIAEPGYFAIENHHASLADQDVLWAEIAMDQTKRSGRKPIGLLSEVRLQSRMALAGPQQIGLKAQLEKLRRGGETGADFRVVPGVPMNCGEGGGSPLGMVDFRLAC